MAISAVRKQSVTRKTDGGIHHPLMRRSDISKDVERAAMGMFQPPFMSNHELLNFKVQFRQFFYNPVGLHAYPHNTFDQIHNVSGVIGPLVGTIDDSAPFVGSHSIPSMIHPIADFPLMT